MTPSLFIYFSSVPGRGPLLRVPRAGFGPQPAIWDDLFYTLHDDRQYAAMPLYAYTAARFNHRHYATKKEFHACSLCALLQTLQLATPITNLICRCRSSNMTMIACWSIEEAPYPGFLDVSDKLLCVIMLTCWTVQIYRLLTWTRLSFHWCMVSSVM